MSELCLKSKYQPASEIWKGTRATGASYSLTIPCLAPHIGEKATTVREPDNEYDRFAVAVLKQEGCCVVRHIPREISNYVSFSTFSSMEGRGSISNCASSAKNNYIFCDA